MTFVTLDSKDWCKGLYHRGELHFENIPKTVSKTWKYSPYLEPYTIEYGYLYSQGKSIDDICPPHLSEIWQQKTKRLKAFHNSFVESKVSLEENCFFDLVPKQFLMELCEVKVKIIEHLFETSQKPDNYHLLLESEKIIQQIANRDLNTDLSVLRNNLNDPRSRSLLERIKNKQRIEYNLFGTKTGRLTTKPNTFPILNLDSKYRSIIKPNNDIFVELDFNAAEVRVLLGLIGESQPKEDIHQWNAKRIGCTREDAKRDIFAWLYGSQKVDSSKYEKIFGLNKVVDRFYDGKFIVNPYNRKISSDDFHKVNYLVQSTANDLVLDQLIKLNRFLSGKKSHISFMVHDSIVIDLSKEDRHIVNDLVEIFSNTSFGHFPVNISIGKDYGSLRKI